MLRLRPRGKVREFLFGMLLVATVVGVSGVMAWGIVAGARHLTAALAADGWLWNIVLTVAEIVLLSTTFAGRGLIDAGRRMRRALHVSVDDGRAALSHLCSRDARALTRSELCGATVESLSENASDSFVAPLFWYALVASLGGPGLVGVAAYRATNTLDAMVGYRGQYEYLGKVAARLDDVLNWVPARLTALVLLVAAALCRLNVKQAWHVAWRDHSATESPNAGWPMALAAGALNVELTKRDVYVLGEGRREPQVETIQSCERLVSVGLAVFTVVTTAWLWGVHD
jgi:adenosylcobinamide-phosphate synthase